MNLSRRGFLKSLLATSALAPIAPALVAETTSFDKIRAAKVFIESTPLYPDPSGNLWFVIHQGWGETIAEWKQIDSSDVYLDPPLFQGALGHIDGMWIREPEEEPIIDQIRRREFEDVEWAPDRRVTREQLMTEASLGLSRPFLDTLARDLIGQAF